MSETIGLCFIIDQYFNIKNPKFYIFNLDLAYTDIYAYDYYSL